MVSRATIMARLALLGGICFLMAATKWACVSNTMDPIDDPDGSQTTFVTRLVLFDAAGTRTSNFVFGETIRFELEVTNVSTRRVHVQFDDAQTYDFVVLDSGTSRARWQWSDDQAFAQATQELTFEPGASRTFTVSWSGQLADGSQLPVGNYEARGVMVFDEFFGDPLARNELGSPLQPFTVR
jgi:hypothetical protein